MKMKTTFKFIYKEGGLLSIFMVNLAMIEAANFYDILVCPVTKQKLKLADKFLVETLNSKISSGDLVTPFGSKIKETLSGALVREDAQIAYPIRDGIPILLQEESIFMR